MLDVYIIGANLCDLWRSTDSHSFLSDYLVITKGDLIHFMWLCVYCCYCTDDDETE